MKLRLEQTPTRIPRWPLWTVLVVAIWGLAVLAGAAVSHWTAYNVHLCPMKLVTGYPCASCGATRVVLSAVQGNFGAAAARNPLVLVVLTALAALAVLRVVARRRVRVEVSRGERIGVWIVAVVAVLVNWAYVISIGN